MQYYEFYMLPFWILLLLIEKTHSMFGMYFIFDSMFKIKLYKIIKNQYLGFWGTYLERREHFVDRSWTFFTARTFRFIPSGNSTIQL